MAPVPLTVRFPFVTVNAPEVAKAPPILRVLLPVSGTMLPFTVMVDVASVEGMTGVPDGGG